VRGGGWRDKSQKRDWSREEEVVGWGRGGGREREKSPSLPHSSCRHRNTSKIPFVRCAECRGLGDGLGYVAGSAEGIIVNFAHWFARDTRYTYAHPRTCTKMQPHTVLVVAVLVSVQTSR